MRRSMLVLAAVALAACQDQSAPVQPVPVPQLARAAGGEPIPGRYIVVFNSQVQDAPGLAQRLAAEQGGTLRRVYAAALKGFAADLPDQALAALTRSPVIAYIEQDQVMSIATTQTGATWGLDRIDQPNLPLNATYNYAGTGAGVTAYIIDTGILFGHVEFGGRAVTGYDAVTAGGTAADCNGHGTHVSGTVGGATYGVAKAVGLVAVRVLDCGGSGSTSGVIAGIDWVTSDHAARGTPAVANMSLGGCASTALDQAVQRSIANGVSYAVAAGNGNFLGVAQDACSTSPARVPEAMTIGATDNTDRKASWSNYGNCVDWFAPGVGITSAWNTSTTATNTISGTSMATPHVTGVAALFLESNSAASAAQVRAALFDATTKGIVTSSNTANNHLLYSPPTGFVSVPPPPPPPPPTNQPPTARFTYSCGGTFTCNFDGTTSSDPEGGALTYSWSFGDGTSGTGATTSHTYSRASAGYTVTLTVTDNASAPGSTSKSLNCRRNHGCS